LAQAHGLYVLAASLPVQRADGAAYVNYVNRARLFAPSGAMAHQDKAVMTRFEAERWGISAGADGLALFDTALGRIGIAICYDSEFPLIARAFAEAGAHLLLAPSCTDSAHGYWRVRIGCQARALEGQFYVAQSPTVGDAPWSPAVDENRGAAGLFAPPDRHAGQGWAMPADGVVALGEMDAAQWLFAQVEPARVEALRADGGVLNTRDWARQPGAAPLPPVRVVALA
ncbi:MAG TPA: nitrilase-related carbon-nitrogen hydrolase, partial [Novosphingobium sp.]|nr:nitrilase-related carbon-nitrogen hydrolase [Novosphingobium sp.]